MPVTEMERLLTADTRYSRWKRANPRTDPRCISAVHYVVSKPVDPAKVKLGVKGSTSKGMPSSHSEGSVKVLTRWALLWVGGLQW